MKIFVLGVIVTIGVAVGAAFALTFVQQTSAQAYSAGSARLDQQESVNFYGRDSVP